MKRMLHILVLAAALAMVNVSPAQGDTLEDSAFVSGLVGHPQGYSLSCESRSAADWAAHWGIPIDETEFLETLPRSDNPDQGFVGYPEDPWGKIPPYSYGVHADPVAETLIGFGLQAEARSGLSWDDLREEISAGRPVIVWVVGQMWSGTAVEYEALDGSVAMVAAFEHTMILTGYTPDAVQVLDAYSGLYQAYSLKSFLNSWKVLGNMAIVGPPMDTGGKELEEEETPSEALGNTYTVQEGEFLAGLAERFNTTWQELAEVNSIGYPFVIFTGQVLQLPGYEAEAEAGDPGTQGASFRIHLPLIQGNMTGMTNAPGEATVETNEALNSLEQGMVVDWRWLSTLDQLHFSYGYHPGQVVRLR